MPDSLPRPIELERLFARGSLSRRQFVGALVALGVTAGGVELLLGADPLAGEGPATTPRYLALIVLDAFRADYTDLAPMPALAALAGAGISYDRGWVGQLESETPTGHATISTGSMPKNDGIIGFEWRDPVSGKKREDNWPAGVLAGAMEHDLRQAGAPSIPEMVKRANPQARVIALSSEKVYAADAMGGWAADYILYHQERGSTMFPAGVPGHQPSPDFFHHPHLTQHMPLQHFTDWDYLSTQLALTAIERIRPEVLMVNLPGGDVYGHPYGGPAAPAVMRKVIGGLDRSIARIVDAYRRAGIHDETLFVVTADHGMVPNDRQVHGAAVESAVRGAGADYFFHTSGTCANIYLNNVSGAAAAAAAMAMVPNTIGAYHQHPTTFDFELASGARLDPRLDAAYRYLVGTYASPIAPQVVAPYRENTIGGTFKFAHGDHGGLNWGAQHIPLILSGPGVPRGVVSHHPARLMDVAPTILRLMGLPQANMDGSVLADAVSSPTRGEVNRHAALAESLIPYQDALIAQSLDNMEEDRKTGHLPPPEGVVQAWGSVTRDALQWKGK